MTTRSTKKRTVPHTRKKSATNNNQGFASKILRAFLITASVGVGLILLCALGVSFSAEPEKLVRPLGYAASVATALVGGFTAGRLHGKAPLTVGLINGSLLLAVMLLGSLCFHGTATEHSLVASILLHTAIPVCSFLGALLGVRR